MSMSGKDEAASGSREAQPKPVQEERHLPSEAPSPRTSCAACRHSGRAQQAAADG